VRYLAVRGRQVVRMDSQRIAGIGSGVGNVGQADVLSDGGAAVVPEVRAAEGVEEAHCSAARRIVAAAGYQITWVTADETTSIGGVTALRATRWLVTGVEQWIGIEDPLEEVGVEVASALAAWDPPNGRRWGAILLRRSRLVRTNGGTQHQRQNGY
jgi:hypothetical protein